MQRFSRVTDDDRYWRNFKRAENNAKRGVKRNDKIDMVCEGDPIWCQGVITKAGKVDYNTKSVMVGIHKHGLNAVKRLPMWVQGMLMVMDREINEIDFDFRIPIIEPVLEPHPNATELSIVNCFGYPVVVQTKEFEGVKRAAYIPPDSRILSEDPYFDWLGRDKRRVRVRKFRGINSYGILVPSTGEYGVGTDVQEFLQICHYKSKHPRNKVNGKV